MGFDLLDVSVRQRAMPAGIGVNLRAVQTDRAKRRESVLPGHLQHLDKGVAELLAESFPEGGQGVVVWMAIASDVRES